ncbi:MAG: ROK family protein [Bacteroidales bacterium]|nr:ROK family protein [Bacteroidales bacterium]
MEDINNIKSIVGVDVGGTKIDAGRILNDKIVVRGKVDTESHLPENEIFNNIISAIEKVIDQSTYAIGIGVPGFVDIEKGIVRKVTNIPSWKNVELKKKLENYFKLPVLVNNDANCFAIGEKFYGKGKNFRSFVGITLGTGLGSGIIIDNKLFTGSHNGSGEFGSIPYLDENYEFYCSSSYFQKVFKSNGQDIYYAASEGDEIARNIINDFGIHIGNVIKTIMLSVDPEAVIIGGSIAGSFRYFQESMWQTIRTFPSKDVLNHFVVETSELESAVLGAGALCLQYLPELQHA